METQKASRGELIVQFIYATAAGLGFAYVSVLILTLATGNREPLTEHPGLTAFLCLLSGISLANLCRLQSPRFWKIADLVWIVTFVPTLAMTVVLHFQEESREEYDRKINSAVKQHVTYLDFWDQFKKSYCPNGPQRFLHACGLVEYHFSWAEEFAKSEDHLAAFVRGDNDWKNPGTGSYTFGPQDDSRTYFSVKMQDSQRYNMAELLVNFVTISKTIDGIDTENLHLPLHPQDQGVQALRDQLYERRFAIQLERLKVEREVNDLPNNLTTAIHLGEIAYTINRSMEMIQEIKNILEDRINGQIPNAKFLALMLTCFIFPFRVGKSIFEIAAKKESKNAAVSS
ncbi:MAG: hypothetical protein RIB30_05150 [Thalassospira sp.]|uniref:hypothetical protein n=1 Tax=Thalassospira sp. TaxID=1912094 RepID=UPI0032EE9D18